MSRSVVLLSPTPVPCIGSLEEPLALHGLGITAGAGISADQVAVEHCVARKRLMAQSAVTTTLTCRVSPATVLAHSTHPHSMPGVRHTT